jgi:hypothetical protein
VTGRVGVAQWIPQHVTVAKDSAFNHPFQTALIGRIISKTMTNTASKSVHLS